ncbi:MAG: Gfo/Idh/MocA family oxidoreductase, partial [Verrucomicrobiales bacterium]|nr:Gfo/Idh/MocA family oxidoreductase [Verrucomicrobiales bacterium]
LHQIMSNESIVRWGILSTAEIARKNWRAIRNSGNGIVTAVASRDAERSRRFIAECQTQAPFDDLPQAFGNYEALLASKDVDAVYVPLPTGLRKEWVIRAAAAGKHVICEKPCATGVSHLQEMFTACHRNRVQFMDGVMFMHSRRLQAIRNELDDGRIGQIRRLALGFSFAAPPEFFTGNIRAHSSLEPDGCLGDLGWYCIRFALWAMQGQLPRGATGRVLSQLGRTDSPAPVPTEFSAELFFEEGVSAGFYCSFIAELQQWAHVSGTKGSLRIADFVLPYFGNELAFEVSNPVYRVSGCDFNMEPNTRRHAVPEYSNSHASAQETNLFRNFAQQVRSGRVNQDWFNIAMKTQQVMEACLASARADGRFVTVA